MKNIKPLAGKPLIAYAIEQSLKSKLVQRTIVSTDHADIARISAEYGAEVIMRPEDIAQDDTPDLPVFQHAIALLENRENYRPDILVHLRCTTPFRTFHDIDTGIQKMLDTGASGVRTVNPVTEAPFWMDTISEEDILKPFIPGGRKYRRRQDLPKVYRTNGIVDVVRTEIIMEQNDMYAEDDQRAVITETERSFEIDTQMDFFICEQILKEGYLEQWGIR